VTRPFAEASARNGPPILGVLRREFASARSVLEIGSGTGQHAVLFGAAMPHLTWQTSDLEANHGAIRSWLTDGGAPNVLPPLQLDVRSPGPVEGRYDAVFSANTAHIMSRQAVEGMFELVAEVLAAGGCFCLYGPFAHGGRFNAPGNAAFDASLRARDASMGLRDLDDLDATAGTLGLERQRLYAMPANNQLVVWRKSAEWRAP